MLGELTGEEETDGSLDFAGRQSVLLVVADEAGGLVGDLLEDVVDEGVHDGHGFLGDSGISMDLFQNFVDVDREGFVSGLSSFGLVTCLFGGFFNCGGSFGCSSSWDMFSRLFLRCHLFLIEYYVTFCLYSSN